MKNVSFFNLGYLWCCVIFLPSFHTSSIQIRGETAKALMGACSDRVVYEVEAQVTRSNQGVPLKPNPKRTRGALELCTDAKGQCQWTLDAKGNLDRFYHLGLKSVAARPLLQVLQKQDFKNIILQLSAQGTLKDLGNGTQSLHWQDISGDEKVIIFDENRQLLLGYSSYHSNGALQSKVVFKYKSDGNKWSPSTSVLHLYEPYLGAPSGEKVEIVTTYERIRGRAKRQVPLKTANN